LGTEEKIRSEEEGEQNGREIGVEDKYPDRI